MCSEHDTTRVTADDGDEGRMVKRSRHSAKTKRKRSARRDALGSSWSRAWPYGRCHDDAEIGSAQKKRRL